MLRVLLCLGFGLGNIPGYLSIWIISKPFLHNIRQPMKFFLQNLSFVEDRLEINSIDVAPQRLSSLSIVKQIPTRMLASTASRITVVSSISTTFGTVLCLLV